MSQEKTHIVIFADASADWVIAGLRQIDRLQLLLQEAGVSPQAVRIVGRDFVAAEPTICLTSRLLVVRDGMNELLAQLATTADVSTAEAELRRVGARMLASLEDVPAAERWFMRSLGKAQDGFVARYFDRRISTQISRVLLHFGAQPLHATILGFLVGLAGCIFFLRGDYTSVLIGMLLLYAFSILDGCDGEIARAKYLESAAGQRIDLFVDVAVSVLFFVALGFGLTHVTQRSLFLIEGFCAAVLTIASEVMLAILASNPCSASDGTFFYDRHVEMLGHSGVFVFGRRAVHATVQLTKRDVSLFLFVILAAINAPAWILHLSLGMAFLAAGVASVALIRRPTARSAAPAAEIPRRGPA